MKNVPSKKVIWLIVILMVTTVGLFWYLGYKDRKEKVALKEKYAEEILLKRQSLEKAALQEVNKPATVVDEGSVPKPATITPNSSSSEQALYYNYGLAVAQALKPLSQTRESEPRAVLNALDKGDPSLLKPVTISRSLHQQALDNMKKIVVPKDLESRHLKMMNQVNLLIYRLTKMSLALSEPTTALKNSESFITDYDSFILSIKALNQFFFINKVVFPEGSQINIFVNNA